MGTNLVSIPPYLAASAPDNSIAIVSTLIGFHATGSNWPIKISNDGGVGKFYAGNGSDKYISWDGSDLVVHGSGTFTGTVTASTFTLQGGSGIGSMTADSGIEFNDTDAPPTKTKIWHDGILGTFSSGSTWNIDSGSGDGTLHTLTLNQATGTAPLTVTSTTQVANLNVSFLEGHPASDFAGSSLTLGTGHSNAAYGDHTHSWDNSWNTSVSSIIDNWSFTGSVLWADESGDADTVGGYTPAQLMAGALTLGTGHSNAAYGDHTHDYSGVYAVTSHTHAAYSLTSHTHDYSGVYAAYSHTHSYDPAGTGHSEATAHVTAHENSYIHANIANGQIAYGWNNHANAGYLVASGFGGTGNGTTVAYANHDHSGTYVGVNGTALNATNLGNHPSTYYSIDGHTHSTYCTTNGSNANSSGGAWGIDIDGDANYAASAGDAHTLDGSHASAFAPVSHSHGSFSGAGLTIVTVSNGIVTWGA
jgi:hypothetical protein